MLCFGACDVFIVAAYEDLASVDDVMKKWTCFVSGEEFLFTMSLNLHEKVLMMCSLPSTSCDNIAPIA